MLPREQKVKALKNFPVPKNVKQLQGFHGLASYFRRFCRNFAKMAYPLTKLFKTNAVWEWGKEQQTAFDELKSALINAELLAYPDSTRPFFLHTDASIHGLGACLMQHDKNDDRFFRPVGYASRALLDRETRYVISELEGLAVVFGLTYFKWMIQGCDITVVTDHSALIHLLDCKVPKSNRMFR